MQAFTDLDVCSKSSNVCICYEHLKDCDHDLMMNGLCEQSIQRKHTSSCTSSLPHTKFYTGPNWKHLQKTN